MSNHGTFHGLAKLARRAGLKVGANADTPAPAADPADEDEDEDQDPAEPTPASAPTPTPAPAPNPEPNPDDESEDDPEPEPEPEPAPSANTGSVDYRAGVTATNGRWAAVLASPAARANLELATDLLADTNMKPSAIVGMCERHKAGTKPTGMDRLATTPRPNLGGGGGNGGPAADADEGKTVRKGAAARVNARLGGRGVKARRAAAAKQEG